MKTLFPILIICQLFTSCFASTYLYDWTPVCQSQDKRGSLSVRGDIVRQFTDEHGLRTVVMDNLERKIEVKCKSSLGNPRISKDGTDLTSNWPGTNSSERREGYSRGSVNLTLWKQNFTTFWKVDKLIKCNAGTKQECSARVIEVKDGNWVKGNCTVQGQTDGKKLEIMNCNIRDWVENAMRMKGNSACFREGMDFGGEAEYVYSYRNHKSNNWTQCREYSEETGELEHREERVTHIKCDVTGHDNSHFLVKMEKTHHSKVSAGLAFLKPPACNEAAYFWVEGEKKETHISIPKEQYLGAVIGVPVVVVFLILMSAFFFCRKHKYKHKYLKSTSRSEADTEQGSPLSEYQQANSGFDPNYREQEGGNPPKESKISLVSLQRSVSDYPVQKPEVQINPSLPITAMPHLLEMDPRLELPRERLKLGYYLGQGQFGLVYEGSATGLFGEHEDKVVKVAVKEIKDTKAEGWADELKILSSLDMHLNLVNLLGACTWPPNLPTYILLEYCSFGDLKKFLCKHKDEFESRLKGVPGNYESPYTATLLLRWCYDIAQGMAYLSKEKVMHGDLAARNIMVGENFTAKISDFGLSKIIPYYNEDYKKTQRKLIPWAWMATEYLKTGDFNIKSDVWSFGVVLWEILTVGNKPYGINPDYEEEKLKILAGDRLPLPELADRMGPPDAPWGTEVYEEIMKPCWHDKASQRPDFVTVVKHLRGLLGEEQVGKYEEQARVYKERQEERSRAPQPPIRMDSLSGEESVEGRQGYVAMEEVNRLDRTESRKSGYSIVAPVTGGYIGIQDVVNS